MSCFMFVVAKSDVVNKIESLLKLFEIDLSNTDNLLSAQNMNIGLVAPTHIEKLIKKNTISKTIVPNFYENMKIFVTATVS